MCLVLLCIYWVNKVCVEFRMVFLKLRACEDKANWLPIDWCSESSDHAWHKCWQWWRFRWHRDASWGARVHVGRLRNPPPTHPPPTLSSTSATAFSCCHVWIHANVNNYLRHYLYTKWKCRNFWIQTHINLVHTDASYIACANIDVRGIHRWTWIYTYQ